MDKTKYTLNNYFRVLCDCTLFAIKLKKNDVLCFNSMGWKRANGTYYRYFTEDLKHVLIDVIVPLKKNELRDLLMMEVDTRRYQQRA